MIKSMTGFGRAHETIKGHEVLVEIRSVNHRYFELNARIPRTYSYLEEKLKTYIQGSVSRGKVEVNISIYTFDGTDAEIQANESIAEGYVNALRSINNKLNLTDDLSLSSISRFQDIFSVHKIIEDEEVMWNIVHPVTKKALDAFLLMRENEGERLKADLSIKLVEIQRGVAVVEEKAPQMVEDYRKKLYVKLCKLFEEEDIEDSRILTEAAIFAERTAVDEEIVRLKSHLEEFEHLINFKGPVGRKCDFLVQELNREINTIGSKVSDMELSKEVINLKSTLEKIREQIQNIE